MKLIVRRAASRENQKRKRDGDLDGGDSRSKKSKPDVDPLGKPSDSCNQQTMGTYSQDNTFEAWYRTVRIPSNPLGANLPQKKKAQCRFCNVKTPTQDDLWHHLVDEHPSKFPEALKSIVDKEAFKCRLCLQFKASGNEREYQFTSSATRNKHETTDCPFKRIKCRKRTGCGRTFTFNHQKKRDTHEASCKTKTMNKRLTCPREGCPYTTTRKSSLVSHLRKHTKFMAKSLG
jgi:hypothetical protein